MDRSADGSAGDADYGVIGTVYRNHRVPDPSLARLIHAALGPARSVLNVGAGTGSYEPADRSVTAVEPSATMRNRRPAHLVPAVDAVAEDLPFPDRHFDAAMGTFTVHQWKDLALGLAELRRVTRGPVVLLTCDPHRVRDWWLHDYCPEVLETEATRYPALETIALALGGTTTLRQVPIPLQCTDGFNDAYYGRPELLLDPSARLACSSWSLVAPAAVTRFENRLREDLLSGAWDERFGRLRAQSHFLGALVLIVSDP